MCNDLKKIYRNKDKMHPRKSKITKGMMISCYYIQKENPENKVKL